MLIFLSSLKSSLSYIKEGEIYTNLEHTINFTDNCENLHFQILTHDGRKLNIL